MSKIKERIPKKTRRTAFYERKMSFKRVFVLFVEKFGCIDSLVYNLAHE